MRRQSGDSTSAVPEQTMEQSKKGSMISLTPYVGCGATAFLGTGVT